MEYKIKQRKGIDDLKSLSPYYGEWSYFSSYFGGTEEEYLKDVKVYQNLVKEANDNYITSLKEDGEFEKEDTYSVEIPYNDIFDNSNSLQTKSPLESYKMIIIDYEN